MDTKLTPRNLLKAAESGEVEEVMKLLRMSSTDQSELGEHRAPRRLGARWLPNNVNDTNKWTALHLAVEEKNIVALKTLVSAGADMNFMILENYTPLQLAEQNGSSCVGGPIKLGADINCVDYYGRTALILAAEYGDKDCLQILINAGADLNLQEHRGLTALMLAAQIPEVDCFKLLLEAGADVDLRSSDGKTALIFATQRRGIECLKFLLGAGAEVNVKTSDEMTALHYACKRLARFSYVETSALDCVKILVDSGSDVKTTDTKGQTVLMYAVREYCEDQLLSVLVTAGAVVDQQDSSGMTALTHAISTGSHECACWLLDHEASVNICDLSGKTPLYYLMSDSYAEDAERCLEILLSKEVDVNATDKDGMTPLMCWARESEKETATIIDMLLEHGADLNLVDKKGQTALIHSLRLDCSKLDRNNQRQQSKGRIAWNRRFRLDCRKIHGNNQRSFRDIGIHIFKFLQVKGANLSVGKLASGQLSQLVLLDDDLNLSKLQVGSNVDLKVTWNEFVSLFGENKRRILQFLINNGVMPSHLKYTNTLRAKEHRHHRFARSGRFIKDTELSLLERADSKEDLGVGKYFIAICFLHVNDLYFSTDVQNNLCSQPWPLVKLCFVVVSTAFGASPGRQKRVKNSQLPPKLQSMLLFKEPWSRLCVHQWDKIPLTFSPEEYEKLPQPRPLFYHWPVGRALVPCDCGECDGTMYKYEGNEDDEDDE